MRAETIVHGDPDPWNVLWQGDRALALIDFDEARPGRRLADVGYFAWKGLRLFPEGPSIAEQARRLRILADGYDIAVDHELLTAIEAAVAWLHAKGTRDAWPRESLEQLESEASWLRDTVAALR